MGRLKHLHKKLSNKLNGQAYESGQAIIIIALTMVIMLAFVGLAVDGGGLYFLRTDTQNAADSAALTASFSLCTASAIAAEEVAFDVAARNGYENNAENPNVVEVTVPYTSFDGYNPDLEYIEVVITAEKPSYFIQVVYPGPLTIQARAVAVCDDGDAGDVLAESAMVQTSPDCNTYPASTAKADQPLRFRGNGTMTTVNGGVYLNADCDPQGKESASANGNGNGNFGGYGLCNRGSTNDKGDTDVDGDGTISDEEAGEEGLIQASEPNGVQQDDCPDGPIDQDPYGHLIKTPDCDALPNRGSLSDGVNLPGTYTSFSVKKAGAQLASGIYCIKSDIDLKGVLSGTTTTESGFAPGATEGVFLYQHPDYNNFKATNTGASLVLKAANSSTTDTDLKDNYEGLLFYMPSQIQGGGGVTTGVGIRTSTLNIQGTFYAPYQRCDIAGNGTPNKITGQVVCGTYDGTGGSGITIFFESAPIFDPEPTIGLLQ